MLRPDSVSFDVDTRSGPNISGGSFTGFVLNLQKLKAIAGRKLPADAIWKLARLTITITGTYDAAAATLTGTVAGKRFYELVRRVQLAPKGWKCGNMVDAGGKALRRRSLFMHGHLGIADVTDQTDADATDSAFRLVIPIDCYDPRAERPEDYCPSLVHVGDGSLQLDFESGALSGFITGLGAFTDAPTITVDADVFAGDPEVPMIWRFQERTAQSGNRFPFNVTPDYMRAVWMHVRGSQEGASSHLEAVFEGDRTLQVEAGGVRVIEDQTITGLAERFNTQQLYDDNNRETASDPAVLPLMFAHQMKNTKPPSFASDGFVEASAEIRNSGNDSSGNDVMLCTDEVYEPRDGSEALRQYLSAAGASGRVKLGRVTKSKKKSIDPAKAGRVPARILSVG